MRLRPAAGSEVDLRREAAATEAGDEDASVASNEKKKKALDFLLQQWKHQPFGLLYYSIREEEDWTKACATASNIRQKPEKNVQKLVQDFINKLHSRYSNE